MPYSNYASGHRFVWMVKDGDEAVLTLTSGRSTRRQHHQHWPLPIPTTLLLRPPRRRRRRARSNQAMARTPRSCPARPRSPIRRAQGGNRQGRPAEHRRLLRELQLQEGEEHCCDPPRGRAVPGESRGYGCGRNELGAHCEAGGFEWEGCERWCEWE